MGLAPGVKNSNSAFAWEEFYGAGECGQRSQGVRSDSDQEQGESGLCPLPVSPPPTHTHWPIARGQIRDLG